MKAPAPAAVAAVSPANGPPPAAPPGLVAHWVRAGIASPGARWAPLSGGRTNALWRIEPRPGPGGGDALVCKLYRPGSDTPLFANDAAAERRALAALAGTGLAPRLVAAADTAAGPSLVYTHVGGRAWRAGDDPAPVARALARMHRLPAPAELPKAPVGAAALAVQTRAMLDGLGAVGAALAGRAPELPELAARPRVFLHGDATAGNALVTAGGITFIDWQCPARGEAAEDLATFLSPAMQAISGNPPLTPAQEEAFLAAYGDSATVARYRALEPVFHWRMAAYCLWRAARGEAGYAAAAELELAALR